MCITVTAVVELLWAIYLGLAWDKHARWCCEEWRFGYRAHYLWFLAICNYILISNVGNMWSSGPQTFLTDSWHWILNFCRFIYFLSGFCFRSEFYFRNISSTTFRARDLVTMAEVVSTRLTSLERVTSTGVGSVSRGARAKPNSHGRSLRPTLLNGADTMVFLLTRYLLGLEQMQMTTEVSG